MPTQPPVAAPTVSQEWRTSEKIWYPVWKENDGTVITNEAGLIPVKPLFELVAIAVYHIVKFYETAAYSEATYKAQLNAVNSDTWRSWDPAQAWMSEIHVSHEKTLGSGTAAKTGYEVHYVVRCIDRTDGWKVEHPNAGWAYKDSGNYSAFEGFIGNLDGSGEDAGVSTTTILTAETKKTTAFTGILG